MTKNRLSRIEFNNCTSTYHLRSNGKWVILTGNKDTGNIAELKKMLQQVSKERDAAVKERDAAVKETNKAIQNLSQPPLLVARVNRVLSKSFAIVQTPAGGEFLVPYPSFILHPRDIVALNQNTLAIVKILPPIEEDTDAYEPLNEIHLLRDVLIEIRETLRLLREKPDAPQS